LRRNTLTHSARCQYNFRALQDAGNMHAGPRVLSKPIRTVLRWQLIATAALTLLAWILAGLHGALSAALGGAVSVCAGGLSAIVAATGKTQSAGGVLIAALLAEGIKIGLIAILLWLVLARYDAVVAPAFFGSFFVTILLFSMAFFVRETK
jgi:ATP synthase protein I